MSEQFKTVPELDEALSVQGTDLAYTVVAPGSGGQDRKVTWFTVGQYLKAFIVKGDKGDKGDAATIAVGATSTVAAGSPATVTNSGSSSDAVFDFGIPQGEKGDKGDQGDQGIQGIQGIQGEQGIQGVPGEKGDKGDQGDQGDPGVGVPVGGTTGQVLSKVSATDYDTAWDTLTAADVGAYADTNPSGFISSASVAALTDVDLTGLSDGDYLEYDATSGDWLPTTIQGFRYRQTQFFLSSGTFSKQSFPWCRAVRMTIIGGGGGSGATSPTNSGQRSFGQPGGAGAAIVVWFAAAQLPNTTTIVVGSGGIGATGPTSLPGANGGSSTVDTLSGSFIAFGGSGGLSQSSAGSGFFVFDGAQGGVATYTGTDSLAGGVIHREYTSTPVFGQAGASTLFNATDGLAGGGGGHYLGYVGQPNPQFGKNGAVYPFTFSYQFAPPSNYGGGAGGRFRGQFNSAVNGGNGIQGIVLFDLYE